MNSEDPRFYRDSSPRVSPRTINISLGLRVSATPAFGLALGFSLSVLGLLFGNTDGVHDVALALISGSLGMFAQIFRNQSSYEQPNPESFRSSPLPNWGEGESPQQ